MSKRADIYNSSDSNRLWRQTRSTPPTDSLSLFLKVSNLFGALFRRPATAHPCVVRAVSPHDITSNGLCARLMTHPGDGE